MSIQQTSKPQRAASLGFTLIELMIVVAVISILAAIAISSYSSYVVKTNRSAATGCMSEYANYMERFYTNSLNYAETPASSSTAAPVPNPATGSPISPMVLDCASTAQTGNNYEYGVPAPTATSYIIQATPIGSQATRDTQCGTLTLDQHGTRTNSGTGTLAQCWGG
ncbi:type IV pilin protein [Dyella caseinilytica]|uniref:Type IV pilin protein n=1 Tax=Dyella caseinilytica TaxID=1849581 RepID=A0ABX7GW11_9GAMM|nr:type IV pilin protein [Dyella caseinilytica]QRN54606.1 type IV pilin protein [Dyella caseinilytica]GFZ95515.1 pilus biosynthesis protein [Dyella caseinilytica]